MKKWAMGFVTCLCLAMVLSVGAETQDGLQKVLETRYGLSFDCEIRYEEQVEYEFDSEFFYMEVQQPGDRVIGLVFTRDGANHIDIWHSQEQEIGPGGILQMALPLQQLGEQQVVFLVVREGVCIHCTVYSCYRYSEQIQEELLSFRLNIYELLENPS